MQHQCVGYVCLQHKGSKFMPSTPHHIILLKLDEEMPIIRANNIMWFILPR